MSLKDFELIKELGRGSFGSVSLVRRKADGQLYGIKQVVIGKMGTKEKENALNEVRLLASISCKQIIGYKEAFFDDETQSLNIVMEYADDEDLDKKIKSKIKTNTSFKEDEIWFFTIQILKGLFALHEKNIMHRDLKSANIFLTKEGGVKLGDLNVGKYIKDNKLAITQTGTPYYASPEVWADLPYDFKADLWSLGCIIYEMCCLRTPFKAKSLPELFETVTSGVYNPIPDRYSENLKDLIGKLLQLNPEFRPSCKEIFNISYVKDKIHFFKSKLQKTKQLLESSEEHQEFVNTIKVPLNLNDINSQLPKTKYTSNKDKSADDILMVSPTNIDKNYKPTIKLSKDNDISPQIIVKSERNNTNELKSVNSYNVKAKKNDSYSGPHDTSNNQDKPSLHKDIKSNLATGKGGIIHGISLSAASNQVTKKGYNDYIQSKPVSYHQNSVGNKQNINSSKENNVQSSKNNYKSNIVYTIQYEGDMNPRSKTPVEMDGAKNGKRPIIKTLQTIGVTHGSGLDKKPIIPNNQSLITSNNHQENAKSNAVPVPKTQNQGMTIQQNNINQQPTNMGKLISNNITGKINRPISASYGVKSQGSHPNFVNVIPNNNTSNTPVVNRALKISSPPNLERITYTGKKDVSPIKSLISSNSALHTLNTVTPQQGSNQKKQIPLKKTVGISTNIRVSSSVLNSRK